MAGFYSSLFQDNDGDLYFDSDVLSYEGLVIQNTADMNDGGSLLNISLGDINIQCIAYYGQGVVSVRASELMKLPETEQSLIKEYEQCPTEDISNPFRRAGVLRRAK